MKASLLKQAGFQNPSFDRWLKERSQKGKGHDQDHKAEAGLLCTSCVALVFPSRILETLCHLVGLDRLFSPEATREQLPDFSRTERSSSLSAGQKKVSIRTLSTGSFLELQSLADRDLSCRYPPNLEVSGTETH